MNTRTQRQTTDWTALRDRWERSHMARAILATAALALLVCAVAMN
jgi:hypothetical protein